MAGLGLTGFALGFAFRDVLSNLLAGFLILLYRPFRRSDLIDVTGLEEAVAQIDLRHTILDASDNKILIPNRNPIKIAGQQSDTSFSARVEALFFTRFEKAPGVQGLRTRSWPAPASLWPVA